MAVITTEALLREYKELGNKAATALSAAAEDYGQYVEALGGQAASAEQKAEAMMQALGRRIGDLARDFQTSSELAGTSSGTAALRQKAAQAFAEKARELTADAASAQAKAAQLAAEAEKALQPIRKAKGLLGPAAKAAGPVVDAALMADGLWEWSQTGSSDKFGQACLGVLGGILGGIVGGTVGAFGGPLIGAAGAGIGAALGSAAGESLYGALDKWFDWATGSEGGMLGIGEWGDAGLNPGIGDNFDAARNWTPPRVDPLILDLDGDGVETLGINTANPTLFDGNADGVRTATGWVKADDGFLVLDRNGNGVIDNGRELFGDATPLPGGGAAVDGFAALAQEDTNNDGVVDSQDARFAHLRVWRDLNGDGISQSGELFTLADLGIVSLNTAKTGGTTLLANGNLISGQGSYTRADGSDALMVTSAMNDVDLVQNPFISQFTDSIPITAEAEALPNVGGAGQVRSLREAASLSPEVLSLLSAYAAAGTREGQRQQLDGLLAAWSDTSAMATTATGAYAGHTLHISLQGVSADSAEHQAWLTKLTILERFNGQTFRPVPE